MASGALHQGVGLKYGRNSVKAEACNRRRCLGYPNVCFGSLDPSGIVVVLRHPNMF